MQQNSEPYFCCIDTSKVYNKKKTNNKKIQRQQQKYLKKKKKQTRLSQRKYINSLPVHTLIVMSTLFLLLRRDASAWQRQYITTASNKFISSRRILSSPASRQREMVLGYSLRPVNHVSARRSITFLQRSKLQETAKNRRRYDNFRQMNSNIQLFSTKGNYFGDTNGDGTATATATATAVVDTGEDEMAIYQELQWLSRTIRQQDDIYYNQVEGYSQSQSSPLQGEQQILSSKKKNTTSNTGGDDSVVTVVTMTDDEFDALVRREEEISSSYPHLLKKWQDESGWGVEATRSGRVGSAAAVTAATPATDTSTAASDNPNTNARLNRRSHLQPMLSLDNVHNNDQLWAWLQRISRALSVEDEEQRQLEQDDDDDSMRNATTTTPVTIITEPKLDGVSLSLRYVKRRNDDEGTDSDQSLYDVFELKWASTRGDGKQGQDVTPAVVSIGSIPTQIRLRKGASFTLPTESGDDDDDDDVSFEVRGEVILPNSKFQNHTLSVDNDGSSNSSSSDHSNMTSISSVFSNARNAASGILLRRKASQDETSERESHELRSMLQFYAYDVVVPSGSMFDGIQLRSWLIEWGFQLPEPIAVTEFDLSSYTMPTMTTATSDGGGDGNSTSTSNDAGTIQNEEMIAPMLSYYNALSDHRDTSNVPTDSSPTDTTHQDDKYIWGDFDMDGCVHKLSQATIKQRVGRSTKSPKWAVAHKFPPLAAVTKLLDIQVQVGRTGALTPVAILEPVQVGGVTIQRATLHNYGHLQQEVFDGIKNTTNQVKVGTSVLVRRAGDVIPQVVKAINIDNDTTTTNSRTTNDNDTANTTTGTATTAAKSGYISLEAPTKCPACGSDVVWEDVIGAEKKKKSTTSSEEIDESVSIEQKVARCGGPPLLCPPRAITSIAHAFSRDAIDVTGLSEARIQQLMEAKLVRYPADIFLFNESQWNLTASLPRWGIKSCNNLKETTQQIATVDGISLGRYIYSLSIRHVGKHSSELVASTYGTVENFLHAIDLASEWEEQEQEQQGTNENDSTAPTEGEQSVNGIAPAKTLTDDVVVDTHPFGALQRTIGIGPVLVQSLMSFSKSPEMVHAAKSLASAVLVHPMDKNNLEDDGDDENNTNQPWKGFRVVFTGSIPGMTRSEAKNVAKTLLGVKSTPGSVSKSTDLVVYGSSSSSSTSGDDDDVNDDNGAAGGGKKLQQAMTFGIKTISANEFLNIVSKVQKSSK